MHCLSKIYIACVRTLKAFFNEHTYLFFCIFLFSCFNNIFGSSEFIQQYLYCYVYITMALNATMKYTVYEIYPGKQLSMRDIKILSILLHLRKFPTKVYLYLIALSMCNSVECKIQFTVHWLRYSTTPNATILFTNKLQAINITYIFVANLT